MTEVAFNSQTAFEDYLIFKVSLPVRSLAASNELTHVLMAYQHVTQMRLQAVGADPSDFVKKTFEDISASGKADA